MLVRKRLSSRGVKKCWRGIPKAESRASSSENIHANNCSAVIGWNNSDIIIGLPGVAFAGHLSRTLCT